MTKCKMCDWHTKEKLESRAMAELRDHWSKQHHAKYVEIQKAVAQDMLTKKFCANCGCSALNNPINTCDRCGAWYCSSCVAPHKGCRLHTGDRSGNGRVAKTPTTS
jgi:hypothetical protein